MGQERAAASSRRGGGPPSSSALAPAPTVRVVLLEADRLMREALCAVVTATHEPRFEVVGAFGEVSAVLEAVERLPPDLLLVEPGAGGDRGGDPEPLVRRLVRVASPHGTRVLVCSGLEADGLIVGCLRAGVHGYVSKSSGLVVLRAAMATVAAGEPFYDARALRLVAATATRGINGVPSAAGSPPHELALSAREREVWRLIALGQSTKQVAAALGLGYKTVAGYRTRLMAKLGTHNLAVLTLLAVRGKLVSPWREPFPPAVVGLGGAPRPALKRSRKPL